MNQSLSSVHSSENQTNRGAVSPAKLIVLRLGLMLIGLMATIALSLSQGAVPLSLPDLWSAIWHQGDPLFQTIVWELRLPRIVGALVVGAALGMSGALLQGMLRNSLADPFILGISSGSGLVAIAMISLNIMQVWIPLGAWIGAIVTAILVYGLGFWGRQASIERLILAGVAVSSLLGAIQTTLLLLTDEGRIQAALNWLIGSLNGRGWPDVNVAAPYVGLALLLGCQLARPLNILNLGDDLAVGLGTPIGKSRLMIGAIASLLAASAVSIAGLIGFVGLIVPHGVRLWVGADYRWILPFSALGGAWLLTFADLLSRLGAVELPVGAVMALFGSPLFIGLMYQRSQRVVP
jgi:iron complex transport system permease protein